MLKKLRIKFIIINMTIVTVMMCFVFGLLYVSTRINLERESLQMMNSIAMNPVPGNPMQLGLPDEKREDIHLPYFMIIVDRKGKAIEMKGGFFDLSDDELIDEIILKARNVNKENGILNEYNLRFCRKDTPMGQCYVFADITNEVTTLRNLIRTFIMTGCAAFLVFLGISVLLARWAVKPVEKAWKQQKQFVADASHELKTPLTVITTDAELLHSPECSEAERIQLSESVITISGQMRKLVEDLLELARIDSSRDVKGTMQRMSLSETVREAAMVFEPVFFEKQMPFMYDIAPEIIINGNDTHLRQLTDILLDNASKYALPYGETILYLRRLSSKKCLLAVSNRGESIPEEELDNLFRRFYRVDKARTSRHSYGLGLSIAEGIVKEHHGKIRAESKNGYNTFYVELPI